MKADNVTTCDYKMHPKCDGTLRGTRGIVQKVYAKPSDHPDKVKYRYACRLCDSYFDEE